MFHKSSIFVGSLGALVLGGCAASGLTSRSGVAVVNPANTGALPEAGAPVHRNGELASAPLTTGPLTIAGVEELLKSEAAEVPDVKFLPIAARRELAAGNGSLDGALTMGAESAELIGIASPESEPEADTVLKFQGSPKNKSGETQNFGNDLTRPLARIQLDSAYVAGLKGSDSVILTPRFDLPISLGGTSYLYLRLDTPYVLGSNAKSVDNPTGNWKSGFGDIKTEVAFVTHDPDGIGLALGADLIFPTASQNQFGTNKYVFAPLIGASYVLSDLGPDSYVGLFVRNFFSYAETEDSPTINEMAVEPQFQWQFADHWYGLFSPQVVFNWREGGRMFFPLTGELGTMIGEHFRIAAEGSIAIFDEYELYRWSAGLQLTYFF